MVERHLKDAMNAIIEQRVEPLFGDARDLGHRMLGQELMAGAIEGTVVGPAALLSDAGLWTVLRQHRLQISDASGNLRKERARFVGDVDERSSGKVLTRNSPDTLALIEARVQGISDRVSEIWFMDCEPQALGALKTTLKPGLGESLAAAHSRLPSCTLSANGE